MPLLAEKLLSAPVSSVQPLGSVTGKLILCPVFVVFVLYFLSEEIWYSLLSHCSSSPSAFPLTPS
jgi:hypothetical protein